MHRCDQAHFPGAISIAKLDWFYSPDTLAGVLNFILKDDSEGAKIQVQSGQWYEGETDFKIADNIGLPLTDKGFFNISGEYTNNPEFSRGVQHAAATAATESGIR